MVPSTHSSNSLLLPAALAGMVLLGICLAAISPQFAHDQAVPMGWIGPLVGILSAMGLLYLLMARRIVTDAFPISPPLLVTGLVCGLILRLAMMPSVPVLENDHYRYLWDGAVTMQGLNPYAPVPAQILTGPEPLASLGKESGSVLPRINHPDLRTVYPPVAQVFFALAHMLSPFQEVGLRLVLFAAELTTLLLILTLLRRMDLPSSYSLLYWLNPVVLKEVGNSLHMDALVPPFVLGALLLAHRRHLYGATGLLVGAVGLKIWPVLLLPLILRASAISISDAVRALLLFSAGCLLLATPVWMAGLNSSSGFTAYAGQWEMNNGLSLVLIELARWLSGLTDGQLHPRLVFGAIAGAVLLLLVLRLTLRPVTQLPDLVGRALAICAALFLISPTQFPWYALWFFPLLALCPVPALLIYTLTLPLYYLRFLYQPLGMATVFDHWIVWIEHGPILVLLAAAGWKYRASWVLFPRLTKESRPTAPLSPLQAIGGNTP